MPLKKNEPDGFVSRLEPGEEPTLNTERIDFDFAYRGSNHADDAEKHSEAHYAFLSVAHAIDRMVPNSREKYIAITRIEEAMMWVDAAISRECSRKEINE